jgi:hypothetical protein
MFITLEGKMKLETKKSLLEPTILIAGILFLILSVH